MKTIIFDLDGTLLHMHIKLFTKIYFDEMAKLFSGILDKETLMQNVWISTQKMVQSVDSRPNRVVFTETYSQLINGDISDHLARFETFYRDGFNKTKQAIREKPVARQILSLLQQKGYRLILATNPLFPETAIHKRIGWGGMSPEDFTYISTYENSTYCKPELHYYSEILDKNSLDAEDCMMVGNDVEEDMIAGKLNMKTFLVDDQLIHRNGEILSDHRGSLEDFMDFARQLPIL